MALWQFDVLLVPRSKLNNEFGRIPEYLTEEVLDSVDWWDNHSLTEDDERLIASFAFPRPTWDQSIKSWGEEDGNRIDIYREGGQIAEVFARLDARANDPVFLSGLVSLANHWGCVLIPEGLQVLPPLESELKIALENSRARRFVVDPAQYFNRGEPGADNHGDSAA